MDGCFVALSDFAEAWKPLVKISGQLLGLVAFPLVERPYRIQSINRAVFESHNLPRSWRRFCWWWPFERETILLFFAILSGASNLLYWLVFQTRTAFSTSAGRDRTLMIFFWWSLYHKKVMTMLMGVNKDIINHLPYPWWCSRTSSFGMYMWTCLNSRPFGVLWISEKVQNCTAFTNVFTDLKVRVSLIRDSNAISSFLHHWAEIRAYFDVELVWLAMPLLGLQAEGAPVADEAASFFSNRDEKV